MSMMMIVPRASKVAALLLLLLLLVLPQLATATATALSEPDSKTRWIEDAKLQQVASRKKPVTPRRFTLNLDLPPKERWVQIAKDPYFVNFGKDLDSYIGQYLPKWTISILKSIAGDLQSHFQNYGDEMQGLAEGLNVPVSDIVVVQLVYMLSGVAGNSCELLNTTAPCPPKENEPGLCTSVVAESDKAKVWHGHNLDWNLQESLLKYVIDVDFQSKGKTLYTGALVTGMVGLLHGVRWGGQGEGFSISLNARDGGGNTFSNALKLLFGGKALPPTHLIRHTLETGTTGGFASAVNLLSSPDILAPSYFTLGGAGHTEGALVVRDRSGDLKNGYVWFLNETKSGKQNVNPQPEWFKLQTNYDRDVTPPVWDDRRTPGVKNLKALGQAAVNSDTMMVLLQTWPTFNQHTDLTVVMSAGTLDAQGSGGYHSFVWHAENATTISSSTTSSTVYV